MPVYDLEVDHDDHSFVHPSQLVLHNCGWLIADRPIHEWIPITTVSDVKVTSFTAPAVEAVGGVKMDFLRVSALQDIQDAILMIQERHGGIVKEAKTINGRRVPAQRIVPGGDAKFYDIYDLPEDTQVFEDICCGRTETVFQFNTPGAKQWLEHFNYVGPNGHKIINSIKDMAAFTALDRKGPLDAYVQNPDWIGPKDAPDGKHNMLVEFARRARGAEKSPDILPIMEQMVPETHGILVFQESLQRVYQNLTGCSGAEAEEFRGDIAKKRMEKVLKAYPYFMEKASEKIGQDGAQKVWDSLKTFAEYGFNLSHAVSYAVIAYACAYLKHHFQMEWWCAVLKNASKDEINDKFWVDCGHFISLPDLRLSKPSWSIEGEKLRAPIDLLHGVGEKAHQTLCKYAPYTDLKDLADKLVTHRQIEMTDVVRQRKHPKTKEIINTTAVSLGRSQVPRNTVWTLIVAGAMDSMFEPGILVSEAMDLFDTEMLAAYERKFTEATKPLEKKAWKNAYKGYEKSRKIVYGVVDALTKYQLRKSILPAYGTDLRTLIAQGKLPDCLKIIDGTKLRYCWKNYDRDQGRMVEMQDPVVSPQRLAQLNDAKDLPFGGFRCAAIGYLDDKSIFRYGGVYKNEKSAIRLTLDVGGGKHVFPAWPGKNGEVSEELKSLHKGAIIAVLLVRNRPEYGFSVKSFTVIRNAVDVKSKEEDDEEEENK
jgi:DNA polymerase III alpha subunit